MILKIRSFKQLSVTALFALLLGFPLAGQASTSVVMHTVLGDIGLQLFEEVAPLTVANFLSYATSGAYDDSIVHRSEPGFVIQGGGYRVDPNTSIPYYVPAGPTVQNEFNLSNLRGTIAMAKVDGDPNSATSQWFINLANNTGLDTTNGGFTVFGQVVEGMSVVDAIAALPRANVQGFWSTLPYIPPVINGTLSANNYVMITGVEVVPVPAAVWLFGSAISLLASVVPRKKTV